MRRIKETNDDEDDDVRRCGGYGQQQVGLLCGQGAGKLLRAVGESGLLWHDPWHELRLSGQRKVSR
jgi:hypothetical protein